ncbi:MULTISPECIES: hypothetical protein [Rhodopirellula]|jgi:hypothetical protein|uniref:hypothetical protein n=1 Tax=Rhodopirellula TaxID=265488 RepID=UPI00257AFCA3|nr:hypothetical protein [Rhodopirellula sp. UBA1907]|tara:strand:- start:197 stop:493 length:297 start_codon:yes stop_codon:yes gene_type:complete
MCRNLAAVFVVAFAAAAAIADSPDATTTDRVLQATCRIFDADEDSYRVLANAHVVGRTGSRVKLEFEHSGYRSRPIAGRGGTATPGFCSFAHRPQLFD